MSDLVPKPGVFRGNWNSIYSEINASEGQAVSDVTMFRMTRNDFRNETRPQDPLPLVRRLIEQRLPSGWTIGMGSQPSIEAGPSWGSRWLRPDAVFEVTAPDGTMNRLVVEVKSRADPRDVDRVAAMADGQLLLVASYLPRRTRETLSSRGISYADATGNIRIVVDRPAVYIEAQGAPADPWRQNDKPLKSLRGSGAGAAVRSLLDFRPPYGIRELAGKSGASLSSLSRVADLLYREKLLERDSQSGIVDLDWEGVLRRWSEDYEFFKANKTVLPVLAPRGPRSLMGSLHRLQDRYALSGAAAATFFAPVPAESVVVYAPDPVAVVAQLDLRLSRGNAWNVLLAAPYGSVVLQRIQVKDGLNVVSPSQLAADLLSLPGRGSSEAEDLISWMRRNEPDWRN